MILEYHPQIAAVVRHLAAVQPAEVFAIDQKLTAVGSSMAIISSAEYFAGAGMAGEKGHFPRLQLKADPVERLFAARITLPTLSNLIMGD